MRDQGSKLLAEFNPEGIGSVYNRKGVTTLYTTRKNLINCNEDGSRKDYWYWEGKKMLTETISLTLNNFMTLEIGSLDAMFVTFSAEDVSQRFSIGRRMRRSSNYLDNRKTIFSAAPAQKVFSAADISNEAIRTVAEEFDEFNVSLKNDSFSHVEPFIRKNDTIRLKSSESGSQGRQPLRLSQTVRNASGRYKPECHAAYAMKRTKLPILNPWDFENALKNCPAGSMLVVCVVDLHNGVCKKELGIYEAVYCEISQTNLPVSFYQYDAGGSSLLKDKYGLRTTPMFLFYFKGKLVKACDSFDEAGNRTQELFVNCVASTLVSAQNGQVLGDGFHFDAVDSDIIERVGNTFAQTLHRSKSTLHYFVLV